MDAWARRNPAQYQAYQFGLVGSCPTNGPCDGPVNRDASIPTDATPFKLVMLRFHVFADNDGANQVATLAQISNQVDRLNVDFFPARYHFLHTAHIVSNSTYRVIETNQLAEVDLMKATYAESPNTQINCFVIDYGPGNCGVATFPWDSDKLGATGGMLLDRINYTNPNFASCISHEMGHMVGLLHTFSGVTEVVGCSNCRELVGRSVADGDISGDYCSDTEPEPGITDTVSPCPAPVGTNDTCNGQPFASVNTSNFMSYYVACYNNWTPQQLGRMHCWASGVLGSWLRTDFSNPTIAITTPTNGMTNTLIGPVNGWAADNWVLQYVTVAIREIDPSGGASRWWNGTNWQGSAFPLPTTLTGTNWTLAAGVVLPPLNSGIHYEIQATATDGQFRTSSASVDVSAPITQLAWDPGQTHLGTQVFPNPNSNGGPYYFRITTISTTNGVWRTALNVLSGEGDVYITSGGLPHTYSYYRRSIRVGSDGFVISQSASQFAPGQDWYILVMASQGATWNLVSGEAYVMNLGAVAPYWSTDSSTNVVMGAEGFRYFRATPPVGTLAWRLWLRGATNDIYVKKINAPHPASYDLLQARQILVVPSFLVGGDQYNVGVSGDPGSLVQFDSRQQEIIDVPFTSTNWVLVFTNFGYVTYRINVPVQQIAWLTTVKPTNGDPNISVRRDYVPNEWNNDAYSEVANPFITDSISLVPPTLTDGIFFVTVYGLANYACFFTSGNPAISNVAYVSTTTNDDTNRVGWCYYSVTDIASQLGMLGWDLFLQNQPPGTELAIRRNAVPGRWNYRQNNSTYVYSQGYVDYTGPQGFIQRPGHQADIWYIGVYNPSNALSNFVLNLRELTGPPIGFDGPSAVTNVVAQTPDKFFYWRIDVPVGALGWDIRLTNITSGDPRLVVRRDQLPDNLTTHGLFANYTWYPHQDTHWASGSQWAPFTDWTGYYYTPTGANEYGRILACGVGNPLEPGTYYVGVLNASGNSTPMSYTLVSRGIGPGYAIPVPSLGFSNDVAVISSLPPREAAYFQVAVPTNQASWKLRLSTNVGDALLIVEKDSIPNINADGNASTLLYGGREMKKVGDEQYLLLPANLQTNILAGTYYVAVVSEGQNPVVNPSRVGSGASSATLTTFGSLTPTNLGTLTGPDLVQTGALAGGEIQTYQFTVPAGVLAMEVWLETAAGYPRMALRADTFIPSPVDSYGYDGGSGDTWYNDQLINVANPAPGNYTLTVDAANSAGVYSNATYSVRVRRLFASPVTFDGGTFAMGPGHLAGTWRYYTVTVPPGPLGWDIRLTNVSSGDPRLSVRRDVAPDSLATHGALPGYGWYYPWTDVHWASSNQWGAGTDWTTYYYDADGTNRYGYILQMGMGNPLEPGNYIIGVLNSQTYGYGTNEMGYTLVSRGIGAGYVIPVTPLSFTNGLATITNLPPREAAYFSVVVPTNVPSWQVRLGTNMGEALLAIQETTLPNVVAGSSAPFYLYGGRKMQKYGHEQYLLLPSSGASNVLAGTYYLAVVSEGNNPGGTGGSRLGTNAINATLQSIGVMPVASLGTVAPGSDIVVPDSLEGGAIKAYQFSVALGTLSMEVHLDNRVANPRFTLRPDGQLPTPPNSNYGNDGGQNDTWYNDTFVLIANPSNSVHTLVVMADSTGPNIGGEYVYSNATYTVRVHAVGAIPIPFDGGSITVTDHDPNTWRYYLVTNAPTNALGWDVRLTNISSGDPRLVICRETLPDNLNIHGFPSGYGWYYPNTYATWLTGYQWGATYDWTGYTYDANGTNQYGHILQMGMGNPLTNGNYYIGVLNSLNYGYGTNTMRYTLVTRGIGPGFTIPVTPLPFAGGSDTNSGLPLREAAYYAVDVPSNSPNWKVRLAVGAGDTMLHVQKDCVPNVLGSIYNPATTLGGGCKMQKIGNEHYLLMPASGQTNLLAGRYYLLVASEGLFPGIPNANYAGTNSSSYFIQSLGSLPPDDLGFIGSSATTRTNSVEGGELKAYRFTIPSNMLALEVRLNNRVGNPYLTVRRGLSLPYTFYSYGNNGGESYEWQDARLVTIANPTPTNYTIVVQGGQVYPNYPDANFVLSVGPAPISELAFDPTMVGCSPVIADHRICTNATYCGLLADNERAFYRVQVPAVLPDGTPVIGWRLAVSNTFGNAQVRVRQDLLPSDAGGLPAQTSFVSDQAVVVPPYLTPGTWYVELKGNGSSQYCISSSAVRLYRPPWDMPGLGQPITTPGLASGPLFGDSGVDTNGVPLSGDGGIDLEQGFFHYYAINVPTNNGALLRTVLEAISGNPDLYIRVAAVPTLTHNIPAPNYSTAVYDRSLTGNTTEYGNWVPDLGRYETILTNGLYYLAVRANGASNCRYRLRLSTGSVTNLALDGSVTNQLLVAGDWRYYKFYLPTNGPANWNFTFQQHVGDVIVYVRDTIPPGQFSTVMDYRDWSSGNDNKNHAGVLYRTYDPPGTYTNQVPPLRPGHYYYLGFRAVSDATFSLSSSTNPPLMDVTNTIAFYGGTVTNNLPAGGKLRYRIDVPADATRWISVSIHSNSMKWFLEQGSLPTETTSDHAYSYTANLGLNQFLLNNQGWPWLPNKMYYLVVSNSSAVTQPFYWRMDGRNCATDDYDNDGLPDCWELAYWPSIYSYGAASDPDNDGVSNLQEYLDGTDPTNPLSMLARLTLNPIGPGTAAVLPGAGPYPYGTPITLTATPTAPNIFLGWSGTGVSSTNNPLNVSMTTNRTITAMFGADYGPCGTVRADYQFQSNLVSSVGAPPDLTYFNLGPYFTNQSVDGVTRTMLRFPQSSGLRLYPANLVTASNAYTIVLLFKFDSVSGWRRILDVKNGTTDYGLYTISGQLNFYPAGASPGICLTNDTWHQVVVTRDLAGQVAVYSDGVSRLNFNDSATSYGVITATNVLKFFKDDGGEDSAGSVARIRLLTCALSPAEVAALNHFPSALLPIVLTNWVFNASSQIVFTITGPAGPLYRVAASTNFTNWATLLDIPAFPGVLNFTTPPAPPPDYRFFRVLIP